MNSFCWQLLSVSKAIGGIPSLTAAVVVCVGLLGAISGFKVLRLLKIESLIAQRFSNNLCSCLLYNN